MELRSSVDNDILAQTIRIDSNLFYDSSGALIKDKKVMISVFDTAENSDLDISDSNAFIGIDV